VAARAIGDGEGSDATRGISNDFIFRALTSSSTSSDVRPGQFPPPQNARTFLAVSLPLNPSIPPTVAKHPLQDKLRSSAGEVGLARSLGGLSRLVCLVEALLRQSAPRVCHHSHTKNAPRHAMPALLWWTLPIVVFDTFDRAPRLFCRLGDVMERVSTT